MRARLVATFGGALFLIAGCGTGHPSAKTTTPTSSTSGGALASPGPTKVAVVVPTIHTSGSPYERAVAYTRAGQNAPAAAQYKKSIQQHQHVAESYAGLGTVGIRQGDYNAAYSAYRKASALRPTDAELVYKSAFTALYSGDAHAAVTYASRYIQLEPHRTSGYHLRFLAYGKLARRTEQIRDARSITRLDPKSTIAFTDLGIALANNGKFSQATQAFSRAIALSPTNVSYYTNRAIAENLNHQQPRAMADLHKARSLAKDAATRSSLDRAIASLTKDMKKHHR